ncbi:MULTISPECIES: hypothetical protein [unclassified Halomonas]|uniref:hypothetical protein n=1 Tax=unclassified Halomonas TaxID=2609666 RepID=UPI0007D9543D|nr:MULTISPECIES: hypothetical protein [unclassified Halomonas]MBT2788041.1 hypothetical protein [Halomonas sp. ISL-106]MBT2795790.1 hypothetical protein [Halomonas sp. ISL-104]OAL61082.1 hypothetical protein A6R74_15890 [Halomonas sp. ALS9]
MGKARILAAHGEGRYTIEIIEARERAEFAKQEAEARIQTLRSETLSLEQRIATAQASANQAAANQDAAINQYQQEMVEQGQSNVDLEEHAQALLEAASQRDALRTEQRSKELRIAADEALVARVNALPPLRQVQAWCADYTEDLSGEVATAEVPGEIGNVIIKPGFEGNAWSATEDGALQPTQASTPAATFYNLAMLPGWQKWRPTFRSAILTGLDGDNCSITLDAATSSQKGLGVNARASYSNVPILYMNCNGGAFEEGDKVLVAFAGNVEGPTVVGFEQAPKVCCTPEVLAVYRNADALWQVQSLYGDLAISGGATVWRITDESGSEVVYSGGVAKASDGSYRLDGLPDEADVVRTEVVTELFYAEDSSKSEGDSMGTLSPPARSDFAGGQWHVSSDFIDTDGTVHRGLAWPAWGQGPIDTAGNPVISDPLPVLEIGYDGEGSWNGITHKGRSITYTKNRHALVLEKGCNGKWPEDGE